ncbi:cation-translocating P-type ATPase [Haloechinothrix sp. LS1_15]|uniref:cation-translocating P-type ATPase n=1 Tax=Haloechinothrix sp. LS1_15 TaxID=2652248 RepID=UPI00294B2212|nr:cation-translocating P-type ATPase [Haloechinothrix sp. LS1_15]
MTVRGVTSTLADASWTVATLPLRLAAIPARIASRVLTAPGTDGQHGEQATGLDGGQGSEPATDTGAAATATASRARNGLPTHAEDTGDVEDTGDAADPASLVGKVADLLGDGAERVEEFVEDGNELLDEVVTETVDLVEDTVGRHRRVWEDEEHGHAHIEVHGISEPEAVGLRRGIAQRLRQLDDVHWAEVNAITGRVAVAFEGGTTTLTSLIEIIEGLERLHGARREESRPGWDTDERAEHPADVEPVNRVIAIMVGDVLSLGWSVTGRVARLARLPVEYAGLIGALNNHSWARERIERVLGRRATALVLPLAGAAASGFAQGPVGVVVDLAQQTLTLGELRARRHVWQQREPELYAACGDESIEPPDIGPRPVPLPDGPIEKVTRRLSQASLGGFGATLLATGDPRRATDAFLAGTPRTARIGREGFAAHLGRTLAYRGTIPLDGSALRRLDRVDTVVLDADVLVTDRWRIHELARPDGTPPTDAAWRMAETLFDVDDPQVARAEHDWQLVPYHELESDTARHTASSPPSLPPGATTLATEMRERGGIVLALLHRGEASHLVHAVPEFDPGLERVTEAVRRCGHRLVVRRRNHHAGAPDEQQLGADRLLEADCDLGAAVRGLQAEGAGVLVVARQGHAALAAADVGVGVVAPTGRPSWGADLILGRELADAATLIDATSVARQVSTRAAQFAAGGSALAALVALTGPRLAAGSRAMAMAGGAAAASLIAGTWAAVRLAHTPRPRVPDQGRWHALHPSRVLAILGGDPDRGLSEQDAAQRRSTAGGGGREVSPAEPFLAELANPLNPILAAGAGLSAAVGSMTDAGLVLGLIGLNTAVGGLQRLRADTTVRRLLEDDVSWTTVLRDGREITIAEDRLVRGDVMLLRAGDVVPADARVLDVDGCEVDESSLTGESLPVAKTSEACPGADVADRHCMLYQGTTVASGSVRAVVTATGEHTEVARSLALAGPPPPSGVELRLEQLTRRLLPAAIGTAAGIAGIGLLRRWPLHDIAGTAVSLAVASVPEGLPFVATAGQLAGARRLASYNAVVRNPRTVEALGRVDVLCVDKTGTLTDGRVRLVGVSDGRRLEPVGRIGAAGRARVAAALRASEQPDDGQELAELDDIDEALHEAAREYGVTADEDVGWRVVTELPFEASRSVHAVLGYNGSGHRLVVKGAPEVVVEACTAWRHDESRVDLDDAERERLLAHASELAARGHRVLAVAERSASERPELETDRLERLTLVGLLAFADPVRATAAEAVRGIGEAGVRTMMITGDHAETAASIAAELGLDTSTSVTGAELDELDDEALDQVLTKATVVARVTPAHKMRVVESLQRRGAAVAMTGDGANDAAAIRLADVGVALGRRSASAAREAADIVITDDRVETLIAAITEGRALWGSIREALAVLVGGNLGEIGFTALASLFSRSAPLRPRQFLLVNLLTDLAPAVAIAVRPPADVSPETLLREGPDVSLGEALRRDVAVRGTATALGATAAWTVARFTGTRTRAGTVGLAALVGTQLGQTIAAGGWRRPTTLLTGVASGIVLVAVIQTPIVSGLFGCRPLGPVGWSLAAGSAAAATIGSQVAGRLVRPDSRRH